MCKVIWKGVADASFTVRNAYNLLVPGSTSIFPVKNIWVPSVPSKVALFALEAVLTLDKLQRWGWHLLNRRFLCGCAEETIHHILLHCLVVRPLWEIILSLLDVSWVFPKDVKDMLLSWKGSFVGKKKGERPGFQFPSASFGLFGRKETA